MSNKSRNLSMLISIYIYYILYLLHSELKSHFICSNCKLYVVSMLALSFHRIRLYKSSNCGSRMEKVYRGIPDAKELFRIYGRGRASANSRHIYTVLHRPRNGGLCNLS